MKSIALVLGSAFLLSACAVKPHEPISDWRIAQNGFMCEQLWNDEVRFNHPTRHAATSCRCDQLAKAKLLTPVKDRQGNVVEAERYACPLNNTKESYYTEFHDAVYVKSPAETYVPPAIHGLAFIAGMGTLGALIPGTEISQSTTTNGIGSAHISTFNNGATGFPR